MYLDHRTVDDKCNIIVVCHVTPGNIHDSKPYLNRIDHIKNTFHLPIQIVCLDSGYDTLDIKEGLIERNIYGVIGYRRTGTKVSRQLKAQCYYDSSHDTYIVKATGEKLPYSGLIDRNGYKIYRNSDKSILLRRHIKQELHEIYREHRLSQLGKLFYQRRKEKVERSFADSKQNHGYRYCTVRGLKRNQHYSWLFCAVQNMKIISIRNDRVGKKPLYS